MLRTHCLLGFGFDWGDRDETVGAPWLVRDKILGHLWIDTLAQLVNSRPLRDLPQKR